MIEDCGNPQFQSIRMAEHQWFLFSLNWDPVPDPVLCCRIRFFAVGLSGSLLSDFRCRINCVPDPVLCCRTIVPSFPEGDEGFSYAGGFYGSRTSHSQKNDYGENEIPWNGCDPTGAGPQPCIPGNFVFAVVVFLF